MRDDIENTAFSKIHRRLDRLEQAGITRISFGPGQRIRIYDEGGVDVGYVGELPSGGFGISYVYDGAVTSAAGIAAVHKANLASQLGSINYLNEQKNLHAATLASHGSELSSHAGQIAALQSTVGGLSSDLAGLASTVGGMAGLAELITALDNTNRIQNLKITALENRLDRLDGGGGPVDPGGA